MVDSKLSLEDKANDETLGMYVIRARKTVGLSRENLAQVTRIPLDIIGNIENSDWKKFPVEAYVRSYLNTICTTLKLDSKKVLQWFSIEYGSSYSTEFKADVDISSLPATSKKLKDADDYSRSSKAVPIVLILLAIAFLAVMNFMKRTETDSSALPSVENIPAEDSIPDMTHEAVIPEGAESVPADSVQGTIIPPANPVVTGVAHDSAVAKMTHVSSAKYSSATTFIMSSNSAKQPAVPASKGKTHLVINGSGKAISWIGIKKHLADSLLLKEANVSSVASSIEFSYDDTLYVVIGNPAGVGKMILNDVETSIPLRTDGRTTRLCILNGKLLPGVR